MKIVVTFAVASEVASWRRSSRFAREVHVVMTGIGMRRPQRELRELLATPVHFCIACGLAGALKKQHRVGSIVVARGIKTEAKKTILTSDGGLVDAAVRCGAHPVNFLYTANTVVNSPSERSRLGEIADAVDMETFHVLAEARRAGVPAVAVRAISDSRERSLPIDFNRVVTIRGELSWLPMLAEAAKHPRRFAELVRFGIASSNAARNLGRFLDSYVKFLITNESIRTPLERVHR